MIFPKIQIEDVVQVNDKTRIDCTKSFISQGEADITLVEIEAESGEGFVTVGSPGVAKDWLLDWQYATDGDKTVTCRITTDGAPVTSTATLTVLTEDDDNLFSDDKDLTALEYDILRYVPQGRASFKNVHRKAQREIMAWLDENGHTDSQGNRLTSDAIVDKEEVRYWSAALTMKLIYNSLSNAIDDVFAKKSVFYDAKATGHRNRLILRLDLDGDSEIDRNEGIELKSLDLIRR